MSQHLDTSSTSGDSRLDIADLYVFDAEGVTVLVMNLRTPVADGAPPEPFHAGARYEFRIHLDHHEREGLTYRLTFLPAQQRQQPFTVERLTAPDAGHDEAAGTLIASGRTGEEIVTRDGGRGLGRTGHRPVLSRSPASCTTSMTSYDAVRTSTSPGGCAASPRTATPGRQFSRSSSRCRWASTD